MEDYQHKGDICLANNNYERAFQLYVLAIDKDNTNHALYSSRAIASLGLEDHYAALRDINKCIQFCPNEAESYYVKACALVGLLRFNEASNVVKIGLQLDPNHTNMSKLQEELNLETAKGIQDVYDSDDEYDEDLAILEQMKISRGSSIPVEEWLKRQS